jgi:ABC-2 type transport system permease protein
MLITAAIVFAVLALVWKLLSGSFIKVATARAAYSKGKEHSREVKAKSAFSAMLGKEASRLTSSPNYMLNSALGTVVILIAGVFILLKGADLAEIVDSALGARPGSLTVVVCAVICIAASMNDTAAPSVSLEGKSIWIAQSAPVGARTALRAKLALQLVITAPFVLVCSVCTLIAIKPDFIDALFIIILPQLFVFFNACFALFAGVMKPNLSWTSELVPIKQSMPVFLALASGFIYPALLAGGFLLPKQEISHVLYLSAFAAVTVIVTALLYGRIKTRGSEIFDDL